MKQDLMVSLRGGAPLNRLQQSKLIAQLSWPAIMGQLSIIAMQYIDDGIRVNCVSPTVVLTALGHKAWDGPVGDAFKKEMPSERFAEPDEIAGVIAFLCSKAAGMITGHNLVVDGGFTIQ